MRAGSTNLLPTLTIGEEDVGILPENASSAGMSSPLVYRNAGHSVEELPLKGMPLGSFAKFPYENRETQLAPGDTVLLVSDGFPEMFNSHEETFGYPRVHEILQTVGDRSPQEIIDRLAQAGNALGRRKTTER